jgi:hypothetical protein
LSIKAGIHEDRTTSRSWRAYLSPGVEEPELSGNKPRQLQFTDQSTAEGKLTFLAQGYK